MIKKKLKVTSVFDGMRCGLVALKRLGIDVSEYNFSEIDKSAIFIGDKNNPGCNPLGSVIDVDPDKLGYQDLFIGGSPCQSFSFAGKRKGMSTIDNLEILTLEHYLKLKNEGFQFEGQSYLFWEYMRILTGLRKFNPEIKFLLENVEMGNKWQRILTRAIGINPIKINSSRVSAQNRKRLYWTNIGCESDGLFGDMVCKIPQPKDREIFLKDILEIEVDEKYFLSDQSIQSLQAWQDRNKENGNGFKAEFRSEDEKSAVLTTGSQKSSSTYLKIDRKGNIKNNQDKASCFTAGANSGGNHSDMDLIVHNMMPRSSKSGKGGTGHLTRSDGKTYCLDTCTTNAIEIGCIRFGRNDEAKRIRKESLKKGVDYCPFSEKQIIGIDPEKMNTLVTGSSKDNLILNNTYRIRRLTPLECERLQTVPDGYTEGVSDTQRYKMLGNGWTVDVIVHIFSYLPQCL